MTNQVENKQTEKCDELEANYTPVSGNLKIKRASVGFSDGKSFMNLTRTISVEWWRWKHDWSELKK